MWVEPSSSLHPHPRPDWRQALADLLTHDPQGDHNPYDPVPWSRHPLLPTSDDTIKVGVKAGTGIVGVAAEWTTGHDKGTAQLDKLGDSWVGTIGPFDTNAQYRFVAAGPYGETDWFPLPIAHWKDVGFGSIAGDGISFIAVGEHASLTINPGPEDTLDWALTEGSQRDSTSNDVSFGDWNASLDAGRLLLSRPGITLLLWAEVLTVDSKSAGWRLNWRLEPDERVFGTGERFDALDQRGRAPDVRVYEQYKKQGSRTYFPLPWLWSTRGYGLAINSNARISYEFGTSHHDVASVSVPTPAGASGRWYFGTPKEMLQRYMSDIGRPPPLPIWAYGPWMSGNEWNTDQRVREVVERTQTEDIPATVLVIEAWSDEATFYLFNGTEYKPVPGHDPVPTDAMRHGGEWPDPAGLVDWLHDQEIRVLLWQIPLLKDTEDHPQQHADINHADDAGLCVTTDSGGAYRNRGWWFPGARAIDFTNPEARTWWFSKRAYLLDDVGVDGFKTDGGEHLWGHDVTTSAGETGDEAANAYPTHYLHSYHRFLRGHGHNQPLTFSRAGFTGSQSLPAHWAGDEDSTWDAFRASLTAGLSVGCSGVAFWGWDLAGFSGELPTAELYMRATAMAAFSPIMQYHSEHNEHRQPLADRTPWNIADQTGNPDVLDIYRFYARLRMNLIPYLAGLGHEAVETGIPLMRALALEHPNDPQAVDIDDQYFLGNDLLVAPILTPGITQRDVYLPEGDWRNLWTGEPTTQGWTTVPAPIGVIPTFIRAGACIPLWMPTDTAELGAGVGLPEPDSGQLVLMAFPGDALRNVIDPITEAPFAVELTVANNLLTIATTDAPAGATAWIRAEGGSSDRHIPLIAGTAETTINFDADTGLTQ